MKNRRLIIIGAIVLSGCFDLRPGGDGAVEDARDAFVQRIDSTAGDGDAQEVSIDHPDAQEPVDVADNDAQVPEDVVPDVPSDRPCASGTTLCGMTCLNTQSNVGHCGGCGRACAPANATPRCTAGMCGFSQCNANFADCDMVEATGCETDLRNTATHCGRCGAVCTARANSSVSCVGGMCQQGGCLPDFGDCDSNIATGCETPLTTVANCGMCGRVCAPVNNGQPACVAGVCEVRCNMGFEPVGTRCVATGLAPRPIAPQSLADVTTPRPTLRWALAPEFDGAEYQLCRDRACLDVIETRAIVGNTAVPLAPLTARVVFWRLRGRVGMASSATYGPTWLFHVPARVNAMMPPDTSSRPHPDFNGDGFDDVAIGARAPSSMGTVTVLLGTAGNLGNPQTITGGQASQFGFAVASAGDVNGDGFGDLIVGAPHALNGGMDVGSASIFLGSESGLVAMPARVLFGSVLNGQFGASVSGLGDIHRDGYADVAVGAPVAPETVSLFSGSASGIGPAPARVLSAGAGMEGFGYSLAGAGDVNGDGYADFVVGARTAGGSGRGVAQAFLGAANNAPATSAPFSGAVNNFDMFGTSVSSAGDVNGDGYSDIIVGMPGFDNVNGGNAGAAVIYRGSVTGLDPMSARRLEGAAASDDFGRSVASAGDVNGDGYDDVIVGAPLADSPMVDAGAASVFYGGMMGITNAQSAAIVLTPLPEAGGQIGFAVAGPGDTNGDGVDDVLVSAPMANRGAGNVRLHRAAMAPMGIIAVPAAVLTGLAGANFGWSLAGH